MTKILSVEDLGRVRSALSQGLNLRDAARHVGVSRDAVYNARDRGKLDVPRPPKVSPETFDRLRTALADGMTLVQAARHVGVSKHAVYMARDRGQLDMSTVRKGYTGGVQGKTVGVPGWVVKNGLAPDFRDFARELGEDYALRMCRHLSAEARA